MFSFGGSTSSSSSQSESYEQSQSASQSGGVSVSGSEQSVAFEDIFSRLFGGAEGAAAGLDPSMLTETANMLFSSGLAFMNNMGADEGSHYLRGRLQGDNEVLQEQIDLLQSDLGSFFREELNPAITSQSVHGGALGGGRQGVAQGKAIEEVGDQFTRGATALRAGDIAARDAAASTLAGNAIQGTQAAMSMIPALAGVADMGFSAGMAPYERLAAILGDKSVLGSSFSTSADWASAWSDAWGESSASSKSSSKSLSMGFSDRRLKRHIKRIGTVLGHAWYRWQYVWGEWSQGVMADEVPARYVHRHPSGFLMVDYKGLLDGHE